jgi:hypothetical protein
MTPTNEERLERKLYAAYRLILSWPKQGVERRRTRSAAILADDTDWAADTATARDDGNAAGECNTNE